MPVGRAITVCIALFLASALISISVRRAQTDPSPTLDISTSPRPWSLLPSILRRPPEPRYAFVTFLAVGDGTGNIRYDEEYDSYDRAEIDGYFLSARILGYQLLHSNSTRSTSNIPFLILTTPDVSPYKRARLAADGATVITVDPISAFWIKPNQERWADVMTKLQVFALTDYDKICYLDADSMLYGSLDGIFNDTSTTPRTTNTSKEELHDYEGALPDEYAFAAMPDLWSFDHPIPDVDVGDFETPVRRPDNQTYTLNSGFFVAKPDTTLLSYYISLLDPANIDKLGGATFPDQDILNYAHREEGNMPWQRLRWGWNTNWASNRDIESGVRSAHGKYWEGDPGTDVELTEAWERVRDEMRAFYRGWDEGMRNIGKGFEWAAQGELV